MIHYCSLSLVSASYPGLEPIMTFRQYCNQNCTDSILHNIHRLQYFCFYKRLNVSCLPVLEVLLFLFKKNRVLYNRYFLVPLNGRGNNFMMLPSNIYLYPKIMFYTFTGRGRWNGEKSKSFKIKQNKKIKEREREESLPGSFST